MMLQKLPVKLTIVALAVLGLASCKRTQKFDREKWQYGDGLDYPLREELLEDLLATQKIKGLNYYQSKQLLGKPQDTAKLMLSWQIINTGHNYNPKHKPIYIKALRLYFGKDSTVTKTEVYEYKEKEKGKKD